jgi:hypothetical protein
VILLASLIVAAAIAWAALQIVAELRAAREESARARMVALVDLLAPALAAAQQDPRAYLVWHPIAKLARQLFPAESAALDRAAGGTFPFTAADLQAAHAQWTTDWLAWERAHDAEYKLKAAAAAAELAASSTSDVARGRLEAVENEKLDRYQRRYAEYVRVAKALQALQP